MFRLAVVTEVYLRVIQKEPGGRVIGMGGVSSFADGQGSIVGNFRGFVSGRDHHRNPKSTTTKLLTTTKE